MTKVVVYTKNGCHLCENVVSVLQRMSTDVPLEISTQDITTNEQLFERYKDRIPIVEIDGKIRLGGSALSNRNTLEDVMRNAIFSSQ